MSHFTFTGYSFPASEIRRVLAADTAGREIKIATIILRQRAVNSELLREIVELVKISFAEKFFDLQKFESLIEDKYEKVLNEYLHFLKNKQDLAAWEKDEALEYEKYGKEIEKMNKNENIVSKFFRWFRVKYYGRRFTKTIGNIQDIRKLDFHSLFLEKLKEKGEMYKKTREEMKKYGPEIISRYQEIKSYETDIISNESFRGSLFVHSYLEYEEDEKQWAMLTEILKPYESSIMKEMEDEGKARLKTKYASEEEMAIIRRVRELLKNKSGLYLAAYDSFDDEEKILLYDFNKAKKEEVIAQAKRQLNDNVFGILETMLKYNEDAFIYRISY